MGGARQESPHSKVGARHAGGRAARGRSHGEQRAALRRHHRPRKHRRHRKRHHRHPAHHATRAIAAVPLPSAPATPPPPSTTPPATQGGTLTLAGAHRLLWRAGFGPQPGQAQGLAGQPLQQAVYALTRPVGAPVLSGPEPVTEEGEPLAPADEWGQDHCWWLDRMVRSDQQLVERMTFIWHDWFANSNEKVSNQQLMLDQNELFRSLALGSFHDLFLAVTTNPAMLVFLDGIYNDRDDPNENYAREMMELFSLGADRGAYTEDDVREMARALTGWTAEWSDEGGMHNFRFEAERHDPGQKVVFAQKGAWNYEDAVRLCLEHPLHPSFFVTKLWGYFIPSAPDEQTLAALQGLYVSSGYSIRAVVEAILQHPDFYEGPELLTPPVVYNAGLLRSIERPIDTTDWAWLCSGAGQQLFYPPNVSGWDFSRWLDTSTVRARWEIASYVTAKTYVDPWSETAPPYDPREDPVTALANAFAYWGEPQLSPESQQCIANFAQTCLPAKMASWEQSPYRALRQNALRMLIATAPDMQVS